MKRITLVFAFVVAAVTSADSPTSPTVEYPTGYRNWTHVKSAVIGPGNAAHARFGGMHHIYANPKALAGLKSGTFEDGSTFIFDLLDVSVKEDVTTEAARKALDVMEKDAKRFASTGGWGFEEFRGDSQTVRNVGAAAAKQCFECHTKAKNGYVFTTWRE